MKLLINSADHFKFLNDALKPTPKSVIIASYGLYAGILPDGRDTTEWGPRFKSQTRDLLEAMRGIKDVRILIGLYEFISCKKKLQCLDCERKYVLDLMRHLNHAEKFPKFNWRVTTGSHIKCILYNYADGTKAGVAGSRNFTDSSWEDITVSLDRDGIDKLEAHVTTIWDASRPLTDEVVGAVLNEQGISDEAMASIIAGV